MGSGALIATALSLIVGLEEVLSFFALLYNLSKRIFFKV